MEYHRELLRDELLLYQHRQTRELLHAQAAQDKSQLEEKLKKATAEKVRETLRHDYTEAMEKLAKEVKRAAKNVEHYEERLRQVDSENAELALEATQKMESQTEYLRIQQEKEQKEQIRLRILEWLEAPEYTVDLDYAKGQREEGTSEWLFDESPFRAWLHSQTESSHSKSFSTTTLWITGNPGVGKTVLARVYH